MPADRGNGMRQLFTAGVIAIVGFGVAGGVGADEPRRDVATYVDKYEDPVIESMEEANDALEEAAAAMDSLDRPGDAGELLQWLRTHAADPSIRRDGGAVCAALDLGLQGLHDDTHRLGPTRPGGHRVGDSRVLAGDLDALEAERWPRRP